MKGLYRAKISTPITCYTWTLSITVYNMIITWSSTQNSWNWTPADTTSSCHSREYLMIIQGVQVRSHDFSPRQPADCYRIYPSMHCIRYSKIMISFARYRWDHWCTIWSRSMAVYGHTFSESTITHRARIVLLAPGTICLTVSLQCDFSDTQVFGNELNVEVSIT